MIYKNSLIIVFIALVFSSCAKEPDISFDKPTMQILKPSPEVQYNKGSLYSRKGASLFADKKDLQVGDIIQVKINESLSAGSNNKREISNSNDSVFGGGMLTAMEGNTLEGATKNLADRLNPLLGANVSTKSKSAFKGNVKAQANESFSTIISVIIEETYQNGNYFIKGIKEILIDKQKQEIVISGVIRPYDISSDNSILSSQIANLKIKYVKNGAETDSLHESWGTRFLKLIWPF